MVIFHSYVSLPEGNVLWVLSYSTVTSPIINSPQEIGFFWLTTLYFTDFGHLRTVLVGAFKFCCGFSIYLWWLRMLTSRSLDMLGTSLGGSTIQAVYHQPETMSLKKCLLFWLEHTSKHGKIIYKYGSFNGKFSKMGHFHGDIIKIFKGNFPANHVWLPEGSVCTLWKCKID